MKSKKYKNRYDFDICEHTGKRGYRSAKKAKIACSNIKNKIIIYLCKLCKNFHVTRSENKVQKDAAKNKIKELSKPQEKII